MCLNSCAPTEAFPTVTDSDVVKIIVPYQNGAGPSGNPYQYPGQPLKETRGVFITRPADLTPTFQLKPENDENNSVTHLRAGKTFNFVEGAYPVYYMPGNLNGQFNGKISLLT